MVRTLANSLVLAIGIAMALSILPSIELSSSDDVSVFRRDNQMMLTEEVLVDFLTIHQTHFTYRHIAWNVSTQVLHIDFSTDQQPTETEIAQTWLRFVREVSQSASNINELVCRLYSEKNGSLLAALKVETAKLSHTKNEVVVNADQAASYLNREFFFQTY